MGFAHLPTSASRNMAAALAGVFLCAAAVQAQQGGAAPDRRAVALTPSERVPTVAERYKALDSKADRARSKRERAEIVALTFCLAIGVGDGQVAAAAIDVIGYQALPLEGVLPEQAERPIPAKEIKTAVDQRPTVRVEDLPAGHLRIVTRDELGKEFAAAAEWMLPDDFALLIEPAAANIGSWVHRRACLVVRVRGRRATIIGGNLFAALAPRSRKGD